MQSNDTHDQSGVGARPASPSDSSADGIAGSAAEVMRRCDVLGGISEESDKRTRRYGTPAMRQVDERVGGWMRAAGMQVRQDDVGNLVGRYEGSDPGAGTMLLGSHLDSVRDAGRYDGPLGVLVALAAVERLAARGGRGERLPFAVELYAFADEEGLRYHTPYLGSSVTAGIFDPAVLARRDADGIPLGEAIRAFGGDPARLAESVRAKDDLQGYVEVHIEQGPVLEERGLPVGVVTAIQAQSRVDLAFRGVAGHAGTVPMSMRRDALGAASEFVLAVEAYAQSTPGLVATVGQMEVEPGASNVIPGLVKLSLDVRHPEDTTRTTAREALERMARSIAERRGVGLDWEIVQENAAVRCSPRLAQLLSQAVGEAGYEAFALPSGAGHDGVTLSTLTDIAMLFVRCRGGVSHSPLESVQEADVAVAIDVLERFLAALAHEHTGQGKP